MRVYRRRQTRQYLFPFILLLGLGVLIVLVFQIGSSFFTSVKGDAVIYLAEGRAKILPFGKSEWENTYHGVKVRLGDSVKTLNTSKAVISFYDGTLLRMNADTQVTLIDITKRGEAQEILLSLNHGEIWVNKPVKSGVVKKTDFVVQTNFASYAITGTIFDLNKTDTLENLKVIRGEVQADILEYTEGKTRMIDTVPIGIGQELSLDEAVMKAFYDRQSPSVIKALDGNFASTDWYVWNNTEDNGPTDFGTGQKSVIVNTSSPDSVTEAADNVANLDQLATPIITSPALSEINTQNGKLTVSGTVAAGTQKVKVKQLLSGEITEETIMLSKFTAGDTTFKYNLDPVLGNIKPGKNVYRVIAVDQKNQDSDADAVVITFNENATSETTATTTTEPATTVELLNSEVTVSTVAGKPYSENMTLSVDGFIITGTAKNAVKVFVNDYQLGKFVAGSKSWSYNVKESYGNLKAGVNEYQVVAEDSAGKKSTELVIRINYDKPVQPTVTTDPAVTTEPTVTPTP